MKKYQCPECGTALGYQGICWKCRAEKQRKEVLSWSDEEIQEKIQHLIDNAKELDDYSAESEEACQLLGFRGICPPELQRAAVQADVVYLEKIYYHAPEDVRDSLINRLMAAEDAHEAGNLMCCLAMQGDNEALHALLELEQNPRPWRKKLYVDPSIYAQCGGWTFDKEGKRYELNFDTCFALEKGNRKEDKAAIIGRPREDTCPHCKSRMVDILVLDGRDKRLRFLEIDGIFTATCCLNCVCYAEESFSRFTLEGGSTPILDKKEFADNYCIGEETLQEVSANPYVLGKHPVPVFYGSDSEDINTIGGFANWVQDWKYTTCPDCGRPMKYLAQIQWDTILDGMEGTLYIEVCPDCRIASMHHQQT